MVGVIVGEYSAAFRLEFGCGEERAAHARGAMRLERTQSTVDGGRGHGDLCEVGGDGHDAQQLLGVSRSGDGDHRRQLLVTDLAQHDLMPARRDVAQREGPARVGGGRAGRRGDGHLHTRERLTGAIVHDPPAERAGHLRRQRGGEQGRAECESCVAREVRGGACEKCGIAVLISHERASCSFARHRVFYSHYNKNRRLRVC